jgi:cyclopropane-fatty-acyl-phospholipid synthase
MASAPGFDEDNRSGNVAGGTSLAVPPERDQPFALRSLLARPVDVVVRRLLESVFGRSPLAFGLADGGLALESKTPPVARVVFRDRLTALRVLFDPDMGMGEAYSGGAVEVEGDLVAALEAAYAAVTARGAWYWRPTLAVRHNVRRSFRNARRHYDLGNEFYRIWLDDQLVYTCAYFPTPEAGLEEAQLAKMDHVCRKLRLRPGEEVVEVGCGWGALALHMARHYGVKVRAYNVSHEQIRHARDRARAEGLADRVEFVESDYRDARGPADVFVSIGMLEHVGRKSYPALGEVIDRCLRPDRGRGLLHFIGRDRPRALSAWIRRRIFPGAYAPTLSEVFAGALEPAGLSVVDVENLRLHYARTLRLWRERFEAAFDEVARRFGGRFARAWRFYLAGSEAAFRCGSLQLFQVAFSRTGDNDLGWTRAELYRPAAAEGDGRR